MENDRTADKLQFSFKFDPAHFLSIYKSKIFYVNMKIVGVHGGVKILNNTSDRKYEKWKVKSGCEGLPSYVS